MSKVVTLFVVLMIVLGSTTLFAQERTYNLATMVDNKVIKGGVNSEHYFAKAPAQLLRGTHNLVFGWSDVVTDLFQPPIGVGTVLAPLTGPVTALARTGSGIVDLLTFWIPGFRGWAL